MIDVAMVSELLAAKKTPVSGTVMGVFFGVLVVVAIFVIYMLLKRRG